jgi:hypothetical protein
VVAEPGAENSYRGVVAEREPAFVRRELTAKGA